MESNQSDLLKATIDDLIKAFTTLTNVLLGDELKAIRESITGLGAEFDRKMDNLKQVNHDDLEKIRMEMDTKNSDMASRIDELSNQLSIDKGENAKSLTEAETRLITSISSLREQVENDDLHLKNELDKVNLSLENSLGSEWDRTTKKIAILDQVVSNQEQQLKQHEYETTRVTGLLSNLANVFGQGFKSSTQSNAESPKEDFKGKKTEEDVDLAIVNWLGKRTSKIKTS